MYLSELSAEYNIPVKTLITFLNAKNVVANVHTNLSLDEEELIRGSIDEIRRGLDIFNIQTDELTGPKILGKISLPTNGNARHQKEYTTPRLLKAAKDFNVGLDTIINHLVLKGFNKEDLKPTVKLSEEMYIALLEKFQPDRFEKLKSDLIKVPQPSQSMEQINRKGFIGEVVNGEKIKIYFSKDERTYKNGKPIIIEKADKSNPIFGIKEDWGERLFNEGDKITFSIKVIEKDNRKIRLAVPPVSKIIAKHFEELQVTPSNQLLHFDQNELHKEVVQTEQNSALKEEIINDKLTTHKMNTNVSPIQKILFGSPGTGKSYQIVDADNSYFRQLIVDNQKPDLIKTVFHPEYTYGDFMGKLMPLTNRGKVEYRYYSGHFMLALGTAYKNIIKAYIEYVDNVDEIEKEFKIEKRKNKSDYTDDEKADLQQRIAKVQKPKPKNVLLVIDEINRGNSAAIFGTVFQLLDRDNAGWSSYPVKISDLELQELLNVTGLYYVREGSEEEVGSKFCGKKIEKRKYDEYVQAIFNDLDEDKKMNILENNIKMPPNLSIISTMNTSDNSIYFMDSAFKRRWDWEFIDITSEEQQQKQSGRYLEDGFRWNEFVDNLNEFIKKYGERIRKIEDKQIGYYFIKGEIIKHEAIRNKLMFFLWDSIFNNDKKPIKELIGMDKTLVTFGDFIKHYEVFIEAIKNKSFTKNVL